ncbi:aldose 1-epimerase [Streptomyces sp. NBC_00154]|uniref:aldose 1-epimerase n=1 Tax=Streptomyces sp. NBC_00154 TaxID=2975670 RepID=UPI002259ECEE|nr:aldose 1-epimerase [Streptomyces sp. NBC_00154]MCX5317018.1 aldose 1-epimerase [Streptomyces sp. NBC_00154]
MTIHGKPGADTAITLRSAEIDVVLLPAKGADIYSFIDRASGIDVLFKAPWGWRDPRSLPALADSQADWLARYAGGWQTLFPNAGPERTVDGVRRGFHGEAAVVPWTVLEQDAARVRLAVNLTTVPVRLERTVTVTGPDLNVVDSAQNLSADPVEYMWVQHPAFGAPFIDGRCRIDTSARTLITDAEAPGTVLPADAVLGFPDAGGGTDLRAVPAPTAPREIFAALTDFTDGWFSITSPSAGFGVRLEWDVAVYPHAWFWQECHASKGFPWFRRAYALAVEPANALPGAGPVGRWRRGSEATLAGGASVTTGLRLSRVPLVAF